MGVFCQKNKKKGLLKNVKYEQPIGNQIKGTFYKRNIMEKKRWLSPNDFENEFEVSQSTQAKWRMTYRILSDGTKVKQESIPHVKVGKFIKYDRREIDKWFEEHQVKGA